MPDAKPSPSSLASRSSRPPISEPCRPDPLESQKIARRQSRLSEGVENITTSSLKPCLTPPSPSQTPTISDVRPATYCLTPSSPTKTKVPSPKLSPPTYQMPTPFSTNFMTPPYLPSGNSKPHQLQDASYCQVPSTSPSNFKNQLQAQPTSRCQLQANSSFVYQPLTPSHSYAHVPTPTTPTRPKYQHPSSTDYKTPTPNYSDFRVPIPRPSDS